MGQVGNHLETFVGGGLGAVAYAPPDVARRFCASLDVKKVVDLLRRAAQDLESGDGIGAVAASSEAYVRLVLFHRTQNG